MLVWMFFEQYNHDPNIATMRFWLAYVGEARLSEAQRAQIPAKRTAGEAALKLMDEHLADRRFFIGDHLTLADVALYAYTHVADEGGFALSAFPYVGELMRSEEHPSELTSILRISHAVLFGKQKTDTFRRSQYPTSALY